jgi:hypothetical protein
MNFCTTADAALRKCRVKKRQRNQWSLAMILSHRLYTSALIGLSGVATMVAMGQGHMDPAMVIIAGLGATVAGLPVAGLFGIRGREGALAAFAGAVMATGLGAMLAGFALALVMNFGGAILIAPAAVAGAIISQPLTALAWVGSMAGVHVLTRIAREEAPY